MYRKPKYDTKREVKSFISHSMLSFKAFSVRYLMLGVTPKNQTKYGLPINIICDKSLYAKCWFIYLQIFKWKILEKQILRGTKITFSLFPAHPLRIFIGDLLVYSLYLFHWRWAFEGWQLSWKMMLWKVFNILTMVNEKSVCRIAHHSSVLKYRNGGATASVAARDTWIPYWSAWSMVYF